MPNQQCQIYLNKCNSTETFTILNTLIILCNEKCKKVKLQQYINSKWNNGKNIFPNTTNGHLLTLKHQKQSTTTYLNLTQER